jgi:long-chain fatty acid transport protein
MFTGAGVCSGAGFALYEGSARGNALAGGLVGRADDVSAIFYNPAGITQLMDLQVQAGATFIFPDMDVNTANSPFGDPDGTTTTEGNVWAPPHAYLTYQVSDVTWFGLGVFSAFGLGTEFPDDWPGRFNNTKAVVETITINPNLAYRVTDTLSVAAGLDVVHFDLTLEKKIPVPTLAGLIEFDQSIQGDDWGYGFNLGLHYKPNHAVALGISYRSSVEHEASLDVDFAPGGVFTDTNGEGAVELPDELFIGLAVYPAEVLSLEVGAVWTRWSTYDALSLTLEDPLPTGAAEIAYEKNWKDVWRYNVSMEYMLSETMDLRAGYAYDNTPVPDGYVDYLVPGSDRHLLNFGSGFYSGNWSFDLSYTYLIIEDREVTGRPGSPDFVLDSEYRNGVTHLFGFTMGFVY